jgi:hypothetical protein
MLTPFTPSSSDISRLRDRFPELEVAIHNTPFDMIKYSDAIPRDCWQDVTILNTGSCLPTPELAPKLELVQLMSAGANFVVDKPVFQDTEIAFCSANGVHGYVDGLQPPGACSSGADADADADGL